MESIKNLAEKYTVGTAFDKIKDFLPALGGYRLDVEMSVKEQKLCWVRIDPASLVQPLTA